MSSHSWGSPREITSQQSPGSVYELPSTSEFYRIVESTLDGRLLHSEHSFRLERLEMECMSTSFRSEFERLLLSRDKDSMISLMFHGTNAINHSSIFMNGFVKRGITDEGYIGVGTYLSPHPEYAAAYISGSRRIQTLEYQEPVEVGAVCKVLGCLALVGKTKQLCEEDYGSQIPQNLDSQWAWVDSSADVTRYLRNQFALEFVFREAKSVLPRFVLSLKRVTREVVWYDPNIDNEENSEYVRALKDTAGFFLYATSSTDEALMALRRQKEGTEYRAITAGRGGKDFVSRLRKELVHCRVLVFCFNVEEHSIWTGKFSDTTITDEPDVMRKYATWRC